MSYLRKKLDKDALKKKTSDLLHKGFDSAACKVTLKLLIPRLKILRNKKDAQLKALKREVAQLLETGQEESARVKVEHVIREETVMSAYELIELYCEIIVARLPIIESQKQCPTDLKEAVASVIFAQQRCSDLTELKDVRKHLSHKYGKDFANAAAELRPDSGVSTLLVEKLSVKSPNMEAKVKALTKIAAEHGIDWKPTSFEEEFEAKEALLSRPTSFESAKKLVSESAKPEVVQAVQEQESVPSPVKHQVPSTQASSNAGFSSIDTPTISKHEGRAPEPTLSKTENLNVQTEEEAGISQQQYCRMNFTDAAAAAEAAAMSAELANMAAIAAANFAAQGNVSAEQPTAPVEDISTSSRVSLQSKQPEPTVQQPLQMDDRIKNRYMENSIGRGTFQGGPRDDFRRESKKEYYDGNSNSNRFRRPMSGPTPTFVNDHNKPDGMLGSVDGTFHEKGSGEHISVGHYRQSEVMDHNVHIEADRVKSNRCQYVKSEDQQESRTTTGTPHEELERKIEHSQHGGSFNRTRTGTPAEERERKFERSERAGSFNRNAISQTTSDIASYTRSSSRMRTSASDRVVDDNTEKAGIRVQDSVDMAPSSTSVQATFRDNSQKEQTKHDVDYGQRSASSSSTSSSFLPSSEVLMQADLHPEKNILAEPSSSYEDFTNDYYYMETLKEDKTKDLMSRSDSSRSGKDFYDDDQYQWDQERRNDDRRNSFYEEVIAGSLTKEDADFHKEDAKDARNYFPSFSNTSPFVDEHNDFVSSSAKGPFVDVVSSPTKKDYSFKHHLAPTFDDDDSGNGSEIIDLDNTARSSESRDSTPHVSSAPPGPQGRMLSEPIDDASFKFDDSDDYDNDPDKKIDIFSPSNWKDRNPSHQAEQELQQSPFHEEESKRFEMLYQDSSSGLLHGRRKLKDPRQNSDNHYTQDEAKVPGQSKMSIEKAAYAKREAPLSCDDEDSGGQRLDLQTPLIGGLKNKSRVPFSRRTRGPTVGPSRDELLSKKSDQVPDDGGIGSTSSMPLSNLEMDTDPQSVRHAGSGRRGLSWQELPQQDMSNYRSLQQPQAVSSGDRAISRRRNVSMEEPPRPEFSREEFEDRSLKSRERVERGSVSSVPTYDPEIDEELDGQPLHPRRRTQVLIREPKMGIPENDLVGDNAPDIKAKPRTKVSSYAPSAVRRSTPAPEDADLTPQMGLVKPPPAYFSRRTEFTEMENKKTSEPSGSAADQSQAVKVGVKPTQTRTDEQQPPLMPPHDSQQKEASSVLQAHLSQTSSSSCSKEEPGSPISTSGREPKVLQHVHPKLPTDYDAFAANFQKFRGNTRWK